MSLLELVRLGSLEPGVAVAFRFNGNGTGIAYQHKVNLQLITSKVSNGFYDSGNLIVKRHF